MGRPLSPIPKSRLEIWLALDLRARLDLELVSPLEGRVPHGKYREFFEELLRKHFAEKDSVPLVEAIEAIPLPGASE